MTTGQSQDEFLAKLHEFKRQRNEDTEPPSFAKRPVDQFKLWNAVHEAGGHAEVTANKGWARIGRLFDPPKTMTDLSFRIKKIYESNLLLFEQAVLAGSVEGMKLPERVAQPPGPTGHKRPGRPAKRAATGGPQSGAKRAKQENVDDMVGKRIRVLWPDERQFFSGTVTTFNPSSGLHKIDYDDGDEELLDLNTQTWHLLSEFPGEADANALQLFDNGGLGQLHSAAEALANGNPQLERRAGGPAAATMPTDEGCVMEGEGYKVYETQDSDGYEVFCLIPGLQLEEIRVQCWDSGKLLVTRDPKGAQATSKWGSKPLKHKMRLPRAVQARSARALVTLHGQLYIKVLCTSPPEQAAQEHPDQPSQTGQQESQMQLGELPADQSEAFKGVQPGAEGMQADGQPETEQAASEGESKQQHDEQAGAKGAVGAPLEAPLEAAAAHNETEAIADNPAAGATGDAKDQANLAVNAKPVSAEVADIVQGVPAASAEDAVEGGPAVASTQDG